MRKTSSSNQIVDIISTLGPSISGEDPLCAVIRAGSTIFRQNVFYESTQEIIGRMRLLRRISHKEGIPVRIMMDFSGKRPRIGRLKRPLNFRPNQELLLKREEQKSIPSSRIHAVIIPVRMEEDTWGLLAEGQRVVVADGRIEFRIIMREQGFIRCRVERAVAPLRALRGINLPDTGATFHSLTAEELSRLEELAEVGFDYLAVSFVSRGEDIDKLRKQVETMKSPQRMKIVAKIEDRAGVENLQEILSRSDGILVGRGDLAIQTSFAELPGLQEMIIRETLKAERWAVVATRFLEGMMRSPVPTRAEVIDVAYAVRQGVDAILLSGETARGRYPVETVAMVRSIAEGVMTDRCTCE